MTSTSSRGCVLGVLPSIDATPTIAAAATAMTEVAARSSLSLSLSILSISTRLASGYFADTDGIGRAASSPDKGDLQKPLQEEE
uniref:Uncharacterized protein n=1 Tax=Oryza barthii TaxID=65489 RepID=A0A0D3FXS8_9ORYZ